jgi:hypothetical protein
MLCLCGCVGNMMGGKAGAVVKVGLNDACGSALSTLTSENMPIISKSVAANKADIKAEYPDGKKVWINVNEVSPGYSNIRLRVGFVGDDYRANELLNKIESQINTKSGQ